MQWRNIEHGGLTPLKHGNESTVPFNEVARLTQKRRLAAALQIRKAALSHRSPKSSTDSNQFLRELGSSTENYVNFLRRC